MHVNRIQKLGLRSKAWPALTASYSPEVLPGCFWHSPSDHWRSQSPSVFLLDIGWRTPSWATPNHPSCPGERWSNDPGTPPRSTWQWCHRQLGSTWKPQVLGFNHGIFLDFAGVSWAAPGHSMSFHCWILGSKIHKHWPNPAKPMGHDILWPSWASQLIPTYPNYVQKWTSPITNTEWSFRRTTINHSKTPRCSDTCNLQGGNSTVITNSTSHSSAIRLRDCRIGNSRNRSRELTYVPYVCCTCDHLCSSPCMAMKHFLKIPVLPCHPK